MSRFSRREFISGTTAATGALFAGPLMSGSGSGQEAPPDIRIVNIETFPVRYPSVMPFRFLDGPGGTGRAADLIKMTADDGAVGWGESVQVPRSRYKNLEAVLITLDRYLEPGSLGNSSFGCEGSSQAMGQATRAVRVLVRWAAGCQCWSYDCST